MARKIKVDALRREVEKALDTYMDDVILATKESVDEIAKETVKVIKNKAPVGKGDRKGKYKRNIKQRTVRESLTTKKRVVYGDDGEYRLTHLLENGHAKINGGRTNAFPHWKYGDEYIKEELPKRIEKKLGGK
mgnify:CR=1 FL=1